MPLETFREDRIKFLPGSIISAADLDFKFNAITKYINDSVLTFLEQLKALKVAGSVSAGDVGKFHKNVGDGTTVWSGITGDSIEDNSISFSKLIKCEPGSLFTTDENEKWKILNAPDEENLVLVNDGNGVINWAKLTGDYLEDGAVLARHVKDQTIRKNNLSEDLLASLLFEDSLTGTFFAPGSLTTATLEDGGGATGLNETHLTAEALQAFKTGVYSSMIPDNFFTYLGQNPWIYYYDSNDQEMISPAPAAEISRILTPKGTPVTVPLHESVKLPSNVIMQHTELSDPNIVPMLDFLVKEGTDVYEFRHVKLNSLETSYGSNQVFLVPAAFQNGATINDLIEDGAIGKECFSPAIRSKLGL